MGKLTNLERILKTLDCQEPDVVPTCEITINQKVQDAILPSAFYEDFVEFLDLDAAVYFDWAYDRYETLDKAKGIIRDKFGVIKQLTSEIDPMPLEAPIKSEKDLDNYVPPDPNVPWKYEGLQKAVKECIRKAGAGGGLICASSNSIHSGVKPENYVAMVKAIIEYGRYPFSL